MKKLAHIYKLCFLLPLVAVLFYPINATLAAEGTELVADMGQKRKQVNEYYRSNNIQAEEVPQDILDIFINSKTTDNKDAQKVEKNLKDLAKYVGQEGANKFGETAIFDASATNALQRIEKGLDELEKAGHITQEQRTKVLDYASVLYNQGAQNALDAAKAADWLQRIKRIEEGIESTVKDVIGKCPSTDILRAKYHAGCWSCLVVETMSSSFMSAAAKAFGLSQKAGLILLGLGSILWLLLWGLRTVSSFTQLEPGNILNELIKFFFKIAIAYAFIVMGLRAVSTYFINPIMGFGSKIAENYWPEHFEGYVEDYDWAEWSEADWERIDKQAATARAEQEAKLASEAQKQQTSIPLSGTAQAISEVSAQNVVEAQKNKTKTLKGQVPAFKLPGTAGGLSSAFGCRPRPQTKCGTDHKCGQGCDGSNFHKGIDIAAPNGTPVYAIGSGKITYAKDSTCGYFAQIVHDGGSGTWVSTYCHMLPKSINYAIAYNQAAKEKTNSNIDVNRVAEQQVIGFVGNTGASGGNHLHLGVRYNGQHVDPLSLASGIIRTVSPSDCPNCPTESDRTPLPAGFKRGQTTFTGGIMLGGDLPTTGGFKLDGSISHNYSSVPMVDIPDIKYGGSTDIMSASVMNSMLGATKAIGNITSENMILGEAIMCYATLENGGAWKIKGHKVLTNGIMWLEGVFIWCTGALLTCAIAYYLIDISFKIGFAVIAMPIAVGLWPFDLTKDKLSVCISIIAKSAATFAFLAVTTTFTVYLIDTVYNYEESSDEVSMTDPKIDSDSPQGLAKLYQIFDTATEAEKGNSTASQIDIDANIEYAANKLAIFSSTFVLLLFAFLYSFKLIQTTVPSLVNKFFPDKAFGDSSPMHHWATAATRWVKDQAMKPVGWARDVAFYQGGNLAKGAVGVVVGKAAGIFKKSTDTANGDGSTAGSAAKGAGATAKATGKAVGGAAKGAGKGLSAVGGAIQGANVVAPGVAAAVGGAVQTAGKITEATGNAVESASATVGEQIEKAGDSMQKTTANNDKAQSAPTLNEGEKK